MEVPKYWKRQEKPMFAELEWNLPEQKQGSVAIVGGNAQSFAIVNRVANQIGRDFPVAEVKCVMPESLRGKVPAVAEIELLPATESGSFRKSAELTRALGARDMNIVVGEMSKNSETMVAVAEAIVATEKPTVVTRDAVEIMLGEAERIIAKENVAVVGSMMQVQKMFRAVYYPKMVMLSSPIMQIVEALHKFTLSYPVKILTLHEGQVIIAEGGEVVTTKIEQTNYTPIGMWEGRLAAEVAGMWLYNPGKFLASAGWAIING